MADPVQHWDISSNDYKKAQGFFSEVFGWKFEETEGMEYAMSSPAGENAIGGGIGPTPPGQKPAVTFYISVEDLQSALDKIEKAGGKTVHQPTEIGGNMGSLAMFSDLDGNVIGLYQAAKK